MSLDIVQYNRHCDRQWPIHSYVKCCPGILRVINVHIAVLLITPVLVQVKAAIHVSDMLILTQVVLLETGSKTNCKEYDNVGTSLTKHIMFSLS